MWLSPIYLNKIKLHEKRALFVFTFVSSMLSQSLAPSSHLFRISSGKWPNTWIRQGQRKLRMGANLSSSEHSWKALWFIIMRSDQQISNDSATCEWVLPAKPSCLLWQGTILLQGTHTRSVTSDPLTPSSVWCHSGWNCQRENALRIQRDDILRICTFKHLDRETCHHLS